MVPDPAVAGAEHEGEAERVEEDAAQAVSTMHSIMMFETSRVRANPPSSIMKPACMKNTRNAVTSTHTVFSGLTMSAALTAA